MDGSPVRTGIGPCFKRLQLLLKRFPRANGDRPASLLIPIYVDEVPPCERG